MWLDPIKGQDPHVVQERGATQSPMWALRLAGWLPSRGDPIIDLGTSLYISVFSSVKWEFCEDLMRSSLE